MTSIGGPPLWKRSISGGARSVMHGLGFSRHAASHTRHPFSANLSEQRRSFEISGLTASRGNNVADTFSVLANGIGPYPLWQRSLYNGTVPRPSFPFSAAFSSSLAIAIAIISNTTVFGRCLPQLYDVWHRLHSRRICGWVVIDNQSSRYLFAFMHYVCDSHLSAWAAYYTIGAISAAIISNLRASMWLNYLIFTICH
jgi:hypothetical protein